MRYKFTVMYIATDSKVFSPANLNRKIMAMKAKRALEETMSGWNWTPHASRLAASLLPEANLVLGNMQSKQS